MKNSNAGLKARLVPQVGVLLLDANLGRGRFVRAAEIE
jgi:hypothetical protein